MRERGARLGEEPDLAVGGEHRVDREEVGRQHADPVQVLERPLSEQRERQLDLLAVAVDVNHHPRPVALGQIPRLEEPLVRAGGDAQVVDPRP